MLGKGLETNVDAAGRAGPVQWFIKLKVTKASKAENQGFGSKDANPSKRDEAKVQSPGKQEKHGNI